MKDTQSPEKRLLSLLQSDPEEMEQDIKALQLTLSDNKALQKRVADLQEENRQLKQMVESFAKAPTTIIAPEGGTLLEPLGNEVPKELIICERQIQILKDKSNNQQLEWEDVKTFQALVDTKLKYLNNTLDLKKASKKQREAEISDVDLLSAYNKS